MHDRLHPSPRHSRCGLPLSPPRLLPKGGVCVNAPRAAAGPVEPQLV